MLSDVPVVTFKLLQGILGVSASFGDREALKIGLEQINR